MRRRLFKIWKDKVGKELFYGDYPKTRMGILLSYQQSQDFPDDLTICNVFDKFYIDYQKMIKEEGMQHFQQDQKIEAAIKLMNKAIKLCADLLDDYKGLS